MRYDTSKDATVSSFLLDYNYFIKIKSKFIPFIGIGYEFWFKYKKHFFSILQLQILKYIFALLFSFFGVFKSKF